MKRIEIHQQPYAELQCGVYHVTENNSFLLATCLTEEIANKVKGVLEK